MSRSTASVDPHAAFEQISNCIACTMTMNNRLRSPSPSTTRDNGLTATRNEKGLFETKFK